MFRNLLIAACCIVAILSLFQTAEAGFSCLRRCKQRCRASKMRSGRNYYLSCARKCRYLVKGCAECDQPGWCKTCNSGYALVTTSNGRRCETGACDPYCVSGCSKEGPGKCDSKCQCGKTLQTTTHTCTDPVCPEGYTLVNKCPDVFSCYLFANGETLDTLYRYEASLTCGGLSGGYLAMINNQVEQDEINKLFNGSSWSCMYGDLAWIGGCRTQATPLDSFVWSKTCSDNGTSSGDTQYPMTYKNWDTANVEPDNKNVNDGAVEWCVSINTRNNNLWSDESCRKHDYSCYLCEINL